MLVGPGVRTTEAAQISSPAFGNLCTSRWDYTGLRRDHLDRDWTWTETGPNRTNAGHTGPDGPNRTGTRPHWTEPGPSRPDWTTLDRHGSKHDRDHSTCRRFGFHSPVSLVMRRRTSDWHRKKWYTVGETFSIYPGKRRRQVSHCRWVGRETSPTPEQVIKRPFLTKGPLDQRTREVTKKWLSIWRWNSYP